MPATTSINSPPRPPSGYLALAPALLEVADQALGSYYVQTTSSPHAPVLLCRSGTKLVPELAQRVHDDCFGRLLAAEAEFPTISERLLGNSSAVLSDARLPQSERFSMLLAARACRVDAVQRLLKPTRLIEVGKQIAEDMYELLQAGTIEPHTLFHAPRFGSRWFAHAASVCCYAVLLGSARGTSDPDDLRRLAVAAMLHDLGLRLEGSAEHNRLTREQKAGYFSGHPQTGFEELLDDSDLDQRQLMVVYQHHESLDGTGFPVGVPAGEIHEWAKLVKVVDAFDELTWSAADGGRLAANECFHRLRDQAGTSLDMELVRCWTQVMAKA